MDFPARQGENRRTPPGSGILSHVPVVQGRQAEAYRPGDGLPLRLVPGGLPLCPELPEEQAPEGVLPGPGPDVLRHPGVVPDLQSVEPLGQGRLQGPLRFPR